MHRNYLLFLQDIETHFVNIEIMILFLSTEGSRKTIPAPRQWQLLLSLLLVGTQSTYGALGEVGELVLEVLKESQLDQPRCSILVVDNGHTAVSLAIKVKVLTQITQLRNRWHV